MNQHPSNNQNGWTQPAGPGPLPNTGEPHAQMQQRLMGGFGPASTLQQQGPLAHTSTSVLPQSPSMAHHRPSPSYTATQPNANYPILSMGQISQQQSPHTTDRERDYQNAHEAHERMLREHDYEREVHHMQQREMQQQAPHVAHASPHVTQTNLHEPHTGPHETHTGSIPLQQPVASRISSTLHAPNGILSSNPNVGLMASAGPMGAPSGPGNVFANGGQAAHDARMLPMHIQQNMPSQQLPGFGPNAPQQGAPNGTPMPGGQQPILNDALSYLDQVKVRFVDQPDVYNQFLDIMKDFKSQSIDTPGVIFRVSQLFNGHPGLIQGFNTFLPPGFRINCDDPNKIRVTTPNGTTTIEDLRATAMNNRAQLVNTPPQQTYSTNGYQDASWQSTNQAENSQDVRMTTPSSGPREHAFFPQNHQPPVVHDILYPSREEDLGSQEVAIITHRQQEQGVSQLQNAVNVATNGGMSQRGATLQASNLSPEQAMHQVGQGIPAHNNGAMGMGAQMGAEKRGPVEFNHAITYVNKIKNRFSNQPEIYKQFLEILQTYQRESKPINDVYAQVTQLFGPAPDLLEDFKQFLPESAAQAKAQAAAKQAEDAAVLSTMRGGDNGYLQTSIGSQQHQTPVRSGDAKMPPMGNFAPPPSASKDSKKRRGGPGVQAGRGGETNVFDATAGPSSHRANGAIGSVAKRPRLNQNKPAAPEPMAVSPSLVPDLPRPLSPLPKQATHTEELGFFDRIRKFIGNKQTFTEFLKLCNMYSQKIIDEDTYIQKAANFIGANADLMSWLKNFMSYQGRDTVIENRPAPSDNKVVLGHCRALGPSYRLLPKRERLRKCSGRDELCNAVLNDDWASHPTWASEDSGFIAHRKNVYEEALHRMEEERHDFDFNIETCLRTVSLLEPICNALAAMTDQEKVAYVLPRGIGGQSEAIYERVIKKLYGREVGARVISEMFERPAAVCPILLGRLKLKLEEWKAGQREWENIWREQTRKQFWKSLDHQGLALKNDNKKQFQPKALHAEILGQLEEQKRQRAMKGVISPPYQLSYTMDDTDVILDTSRVLLVYLQHVYNGNSTDALKVQHFLKTFIPAFFDLDRDAYARKMADIYDDSPYEDAMEEDLPPTDESTVTRGRHPKRRTLLRGVLDKSQTGKGSTRKDHASRSRVNSKESTPDISGSVEDDSISTLGTPSHHDPLNPPLVPSVEHRWMSHPASDSPRHPEPMRAHNEPYARTAYSLYANANIYCLMRMFQSVYERLANVKAAEPKVHTDVARAHVLKCSTNLRWEDRAPEEYFADTSPDANYYAQVLRTLEEVLRGETELQFVEDLMRRWYLRDGWMLYQFDKVLGAVTRFAAGCLVGEGKDRSSDILGMFLRDRAKAETSCQAEMDLRRGVERLIKEGDVYRIVWTQAPVSTLTLQLLSRSSPTFDSNALSPHAQWSYYVSAYVMLSWTEGVPRTIHFPFLRRNLPPRQSNNDGADEVVSLLDYGKEWVPTSHDDGLIVRIASDNYKLLYDAGGADWLVRARAKRGVEDEGGEKRAEGGRVGRRKGLEGWAERWKVGLGAREVEACEREVGELVAGAERVDGGDRDANMLDA